MIIVTGASGGFGRATVNRLLESMPANQLILTTRTPARLSDYAEKGANVRFADYDNPESLPEAFSGGELMLLISTSRVGSRVAQHRNAIVAAKAAGVRKVIYTSIIGAGNEANPAIVTMDHRATETDLRNSGLAWNVLRDGQYAEALADLVAPVAVATGEWYANEAEGRIALVSRDDCVASAAAILRGAGRDNTVYEITGPDLLSYREVAAMVSEISGRPVAYRVVTDDERFEQWDAIGVPRKASDDMSASPIPWCSEDMVTFGRAIREGYMAGQSNAVEELTGRPAVSMHDVLIKASGSWPPA
ncbi:SDR family oxidoreductase [Arthrobacter sp. CAL618]|uniref:SDR family oxidoreductase n=1 Tax=Arthrobacter sp. CAL618 TaxID=1055770 RepID=UPI00054D96E2|nr:SDR family oxidoreductase [Arthrobacter sp. CAL618]